MYNKNIFPSSPVIERLPDEMIVGSWEENRVVENIPLFSDQILDVSRQTPFLYRTPSSAVSGLKSVATEHQALEELDDLLTTYTSRNSGEDSKLVERAKDIRDNLSFVGEYELQRAAEGIGVAWKAFLDTNPKAQLCILTSVNQLSRYQGQTKSDTYILERVLQTFTDEELSNYSGRIINTLEELTSEPSDSRIVMLDDWSISGRQRRDVYNHAMQNPTFRRFAHAGRAEVNLVIAAAQDIRNGIQVDPDNPTKGSIPVRAYYKAHRAVTEKVSTAIITGTHSPVNYGFSLAVKRLLSTADNKRGRPMLAHVSANYHNGVRTIMIEGGKIERLSHHEVTREKAMLQAGNLAVQMDDQIG